jgi:hypothetical protein
MAKFRIRGRDLIRLPLYVFLVVALLTGVVFLISGIVMDGGFKRAWEILLGIHTPFGQASGLGVALSALGYLFVPTVIGLVVADGITRFTEYRLTTVDEAAERIAARIKPKIRQTVREELADPIAPAPQSDLPKPGQ